MRRKVQTTHRPNGASAVSQLGWVAEDRLNDDMQQEKEHFTRLALRDDIADRVHTIEQVSDTLVTIYESGKTVIIQWVADPE